MDRGPNPAAATSCMALEVVFYPLLVYLIKKCTFYALLVKEIGAPMSENT
jgi:hypothetical protein